MKRRIRTTFSQAEREEIVNLAKLTLKKEDSDDVREALSYLKDQRKLSDEAIDELSFGYIPQRVHWHDWRGRVIMPLYDQYGELVALTSRLFRSTDKNDRPHFHEHFNKRRYLYGLYEAKSEIMRRDAVVIVEGQFDTARMRDAGFKNTVGLLGSALTFDHICLLRRYASNFYLMFDNDKAGKDTMAKAINLYDVECLGAAAFSTRFYPVFFKDDCKDPDNLLDKYGVAEARRSFRSAYDKQETNLNAVRLYHVNKTRS